MENILYIILAILGLGFLIFIHELGHYFMAKKRKMRIETFSIGLGNAIFSWKVNGVKWQLGWLPFGGFVKIAGMQEENGVEPHDIKDGFFGKKPIDRILVAIMGPFINLVFAFLAFSIIWSFQGRDKPFGEFTNKIGYIDPKSVLYEHSVKPGDEILEYNYKKYKGFIDVIYSSVMNGREIDIKGNQISYTQHKKAFFHYNLKPYKEPGSDFSTIGILAPASYLFYKTNTDPISPVLKGSGISNNDRLLWVDGEILFSTRQLSNIINEKHAFLTIQRNSIIFHTKINLVKISDLNLPSDFKDDLNDWKYLEKLNQNLEDLYILPYSFNSQKVINNSLQFIDETTAVNFKNKRNAFSRPLQRGDRILAIGNTKIVNAPMLFSILQSPEVLLITQNNKNLLKKVSYKNVDNNFDKNLNVKDLNKMISRIGGKDPIYHLNDLHLLKPLTPITAKQMAKLDSTSAQAYNLFKNQIDKIKDPQRKEEAIKGLKIFGNIKILGVAPVDKTIKYNPNPLILFSDVFKEISTVFMSLFSGKLSPKHLAGPIGIVQVMKRSWQMGPLEALYWLGAISINLGVFNLLPIPALDGGHILFSLFEMITRRRIKVKTMEKLIIPFVILLIGMVLFFVYNDILRIVKNFC